jgi:hypothetical protein
MKHHALQKLVIPEGRKAGWAPGFTDQVVTIYRTRLQDEVNIHRHRINITSEQAATVKESFVAPDQKTHNQSNVPASLIIPLFIHSWGLGRV